MNLNETNEEVDINIYGDKHKYPESYQFFNQSSDKKIGYRHGLVLLNDHLQKKWHHFILPLLLHSDATNSGS